MKKIFFSLLLIYCSMLSVNAQTPDWVWARSGQSTGIGEGYAIATDNVGNAYFTGYFSWNIIFGTHVMTGGTDNVFLTKYDSNGNVIWCKSQTGGTAQSYAISTDRSGNIYITGSFTDTVYFGSHMLTSAGYDDFFLAKYDPSGNVLWAKRAGGAKSDIGYGVSADDFGNVYVTGGFQSTNFFIGSFSFPTIGNDDAFVAKYDSSGNVLWARSAGGTGFDDGFGVATDKYGNIYITGDIGSTSMTFGSYVLTNPGIFIVKYDSLGTVQWAKNPIGGGGFYVATDESNNIYVTGEYGISISFGSISLSSAGSNDAFLVKYNSAGNALWAKSIGGAGADHGSCVVADKFGTVYTTGGFTPPIMTIDTITLQIPVGPVNDAMYISRFDSSGHILFAKALPSGGDDLNSVAVTSTGCIYVGGDYKPDTFIVGLDTLFRLNSENAFIARLCYSGLPVANFISSDTTFCSETGKCISFIDHSTGNPTSWHWTFTGAVPDTSSLQNPNSICYSTPGTYPVTLIVSNGTTTDTLTVSPLIIFGISVAPPTITIIGGDTLMSSHGSTYQWYLNGSAIAGATDSFYVEHQSGTYSVQISDVTGGCHALSNGVTVGLIELSGSGGITIYPNPFDNQVTIVAKSREPLEIVIYDIASKKIMEQKFTTSLSLNTRVLAKGVYLYEVKKENGVIERGKIVKD